MGVVDARDLVVLDTTVISAQLAQPLTNTSVRIRDGHIIDMSDTNFTVTLPYVIDEPGSGRPVSPILDPANHTPEAVVERMQADGAICVKLFFEDGWDLRSDWPMPTTETIARVIQRAHELGLKVVAHANALDMQSQAVAAGVDVLGHGLWNWNAAHGDPDVPSSVREPLAAGTQST